MIQVEYRDIPEFPGYRAGSDGSVWSCWRRKGLGKGRGCVRVMSHMHWKPLLQNVDRAGRATVKLCREGRIRRFFVHRLILEAFIGSCPDGLECCHNDGTSTNNALVNLRWDTKQSNAADKVAHGTAPRGEANPRAIINSADVIVIRRRAALGERRADIARDFGVSRTTIDAVVTRATWRDVN